MDWMDSVQCRVKLRLRIFFGDILANAWHSMAPISGWALSNMGKFDGDILNDGHISLCSFTFDFYLGMN